MSLSITVLVSDGRHPVSKRSCRADCDAKALELALRMPDVDVTAVHAGTTESPALRQYLGMGISSLTVLRLNAHDDPLSALIDYLQTDTPRLILTGCKAERSEGSGFLPYALAHALALPILPNACSVSTRGESVEIIQTLAKGRRRHLRTPLPAVVTVGTAAPAARQSTFGRARSGTIVCLPIVSRSGLTPPWQASPARARPKPSKYIGQGLSAEQRLKMVTETASTEGAVHLNLTADQAAERLLHYLVEEDIIHAERLKSTAPKPGDYNDA